MSRVQVKPESLDLSLGRLRQVRQRAVDAMKLSLQAKGQLSPVVAARMDGRLLLIDGFCRQRAAVTLGFEELAVEILEVSSARMKAEMYLRNAERGFSLVEQCRLVADLADNEKLSQVEIAELVERHKSWVCRRLNLARTLSPRLLEDLALGFVTPGSLRALAELPTRNQEELLTVALRDSLTPKELESLVHLWRKSPSVEARDYVLAQPRAAIELARGGTADSLDPRLGPRGEQLLRGLHILQSTGARLFRTAAGGDGDWAITVRSELQKALHLARQETQAALVAVERALSVEKEAKSS